LKFTETPLSGAYIIDIDPIGDERGFFATCWTREDFTKRGLTGEFIQCNVSLSQATGTVRGMHFQHAPHQEAKLVRCTQGALYDVLLDLRADSPTYLQWHGVELTVENRRMAYLPEGIAHGFQTLADDTEILYMVSAYYHPVSQAGARWNDPAFNIQWPLPLSVISDKDANFPDWG